MARSLREKHCFAASRRVCHFDAVDDLSMMIIHGKSSVIRWSDHWQKSNFWGGDKQNCVKRPKNWGGDRQNCVKTTKKFGAAATHTTKGTTPAAFSMYDDDRELNGWKLSNLVNPALNNGPVYCALITFQPKVNYTMIIKSTLYKNLELFNIFYRDSLLDFVALSLSKSVFLCLFC